MRHITSAFASLALVAVAITATAGVRSSHDDTADFSSYETWAWAEGTFGVSNAAPVLGDGPPKRTLPSAIALELQSKGLSRTNATDADLLVSYEAAVRKKTSVNEDPLHRMEADYNYSIGLKGDRWVKSYQEGSCIVDLIDRKANRLVWKGWVTGRVDFDHRREEQVRSAIRKLFKLYPPKPKAKSESK